MERVAQHCRKTHVLAFFADCVNALLQMCCCESVLPVAQKLYFFSFPPHFSSIHDPVVLQVSGIRAAVQLWPAGYAPAEEANVQRTVSLQAHPVTHHPHPSPPSPPAPTPDPNKMEGQWCNKKRTRGANDWLEKEKTFQKLLFFSANIQRKYSFCCRWCHCFALFCLSLLPSLHPLKTSI